MTMQDKAVRGVVGGNADSDSVADNDSYIEAFHLATELRGDGDTVFQGDNIIASAGSIDNFSFKFCEIVF